MRVLRNTAFFLLIAISLLVELGCGDQYRPVANPIVSPGGQPQHAHFAWVLNTNPNGDGSVTEIDVSGDTALAVNSMGVGTSAEAFPTNSLSLFVANAGDDTVMQFLPTLSGGITTISLLPGSHPVALTSISNAVMYVLNSGSNSACPNSGSISTINASTLSVASTSCVGLNPTAMVQSPTNNWIYIINQGDNNAVPPVAPSITAFDPSGPTLVGSIPLSSGQIPVAITANAQGWIFVVVQAQTGPGTLDIIPSGYAYVAASAPLGVQPTSAFVDPNRNRLYVPNSGDNTVSVFDPSGIDLATSSIPLLSTVPVGTQPVSVTALLNGSNFFVANAGSDNVTVVSQNSFSPLTTVALPSGANPSFIASDPTSQKVYVTDQGTSQITIIQTSNNSITQNLQAPTQVSGCTTSCAYQTPIMVLTQ
jgi:DNA-binding beta-propeller fold protein YncE